MIIDRTSPADIYDNISKKIDEILESLLASSDDEQVSQAKENAKNILYSCQDNIERHMDKLQKNAEWDTFTIAFYGETNAGKSTIIESLRIFFEKSSKKKERESFYQYQMSHGITEERLSALKRDISEFAEALPQLEKQSCDSKDRYDSLENSLKEELYCLQKIVQEKLTTAPLWKKFFHKILKLKEEKEIEKINESLICARLEKEEEKKIIFEKIENTKNNKIFADKCIIDFMSHSCLLKKFSDGGIIGNGKSDFTVKTTEYHFDRGVESFLLLDVPGIEGDEEKVNDSIWEAVHKAHAVFYVTGKAAAPQNGDEKKGTLNKIKEHLGDQTEVWAIFNKRITNPIHLEKPESSDERESLNDLSDKLRECLGNNYQGLLSLSAYPAFLALAECFPPEDSHIEKQRKFLNKLTSSELLLKSNLHYLSDMLNGDLVKNYKEKIIRSNLNKAMAVIYHTIENIVSIQRESFHPLEEALRKEAEKADIQIDAVLASLSRRLEGVSETSISYFSTSVRRAVYAEIDKDLSKDEFKTALQAKLINGQKNMQNKLPELIDTEIKKFHDEICEVISRFEKFSGELADVYEKIGRGKITGDFSFEVDIKNGVDVFGLFTAVAGGISLLLNPPGWIVMAISAVGVFISIVKAVRGFFDSDYKKAQQRKAASENIEKVINSIRQSINENISKTLPDLERKMSDIKIKLVNPVHDVSKINLTLTEAVSGLTELTRSIKVGAE